MTVEKLRSYEPFFGSWTVESKIAEGRHSKVFRVGRIVDGQVRHQCLKTIRFPSGNEEISKVISSGIYKNVQQYLDEVEQSVRANMEKMLSLRNNRNIVCFDNYTIIKENSCFYLVILMELLTPLGDYLKVDSATQSDTVRIATDICSALEGFRKVGIIHHEVRPENVYVDKKGVFKLGDFGVCKGRFGEERVTSSYIAPELYNNGAIDMSSDIYSLGILVYKLLNNNRLPFLPAYPAPVSLTDREMAFARRMRGDIFPAPSNASKALADVIYKATAFNSYDRYSSPSEFADALEATFAFSNVEQPTMVFTPVMPVAPVAPVIPVDPVVPEPSPYQISEEPSVPLYNSRRPHIHNEATEDEKEDFAEAFTDDPEDEAIEEGEKVNKKWYFIIIALVIVLAVAIGFVVKGSSAPDETTTTTTKAPDITFGEVTAGPTTTTATTTTATTTASTTMTTTATTTLPTTTATTTASTTKDSAVTTTRNPALEFASTDPSASTSATETTTLTTTATTTETTTETTTLAPPLTTTAAYTEPNFGFTPNTEGGKDEQDRTYRAVNLGVVSGFGSGSEITVTVEGISGENATLDNINIMLYTMDNAVMVNSFATSGIIISDGDGSVTCVISVEDSDFIFEPDSYQYFLYMEDGAVSTDSEVNLCAQVRVTD